MYIYIIHVQSRIEILKWRLYVSVNSAIIGSDDAVSPAIRQTIIRINVGFGLTEVS